MNIAFRCDASLEIGTGHVVRCLTLANALRAAGHTCRFVCRDLQGNLIDRIVQAGFSTSILPAPSGSAPIEPSIKHAAWAGVDLHVDADQTREALGKVNWLIVDHYAFDARWEESVRPSCGRLMVIDDLADRPHIADMLLDVNLGRKANDYDHLLPAGTKRLIGPQYALLRPEFAKARPAALAKRNRPFTEILITMGGADLPDATSKILNSLASLAAPPMERITVVMGPTAPALDKVCKRAATMPIATHVLHDVADMAILFARADLAIGGAGGTSWERCALGLPTLIVILADNQVEGAEALQRVGAARIVGRFDAPDLAANLVAALVDVTKPGVLNAMSSAAGRITDGRGSLRVIDELNRYLT